MTSNKSNKNGTRAWHVAVDPWQLCFLERGRGEGCCVETLKMSHKKLSRPLAHGALEQHTMREARSDWRCCTRPGGMHCLNPAAAEREA
eukprot:88509-Rhodomonas_salina.2